MKKIIDLLKEIDPDADFEKSEDFIGDGLLDSVGVMHLLSAFEKNYGVKVGGSDVMSMNFSSLGSIAKLLESYGVKDAV